MMLFKLLRSLIDGSRKTAPAPMPVSPVPSHDAVVAGQLDAIRQRIEQIWAAHSGLSLVHYQVEAAQLMRHILAEPPCDNPLRLERYGYKVYSQNDEDGILAEIFRRIDVTNRQFLEFGVENGLENNTLNLLEQGWSGAWLEGDPRHVAAIEHGFKRKIDAGNLRVRNAMIDRDNINSLIQSLALPRDLDLLSIDIDGNDYHVWEAIAAIEPRVVVIEYNAKFRPPTQWVMRYDAAHRWDGTDQFGASLESMTELGRRKGYQLVGCNITGANAFFVKTALAGDRLATPADTATLYLPARYFLTASFISGHRAGYSRKR